MFLFDMFNFIRVERFYDLQILHKLFLRFFCIKFQIEKVFGKVFKFFVFRKWAVDFTSF